jgi:hypothetical protein
MDAKALIRKAESTNAERDRMDRANGFAPPSAGPLDVELRTICAALEAGLRTEDWDCVAEGLVMLRDTAGRAK